MVITVNGLEFKHTILAMMQSSQKVNVNLRVENSILMLQGLSAITDERQLLVPIKVEALIGEGVTVEFDRSIELLKERSNVTIFVERNLASEHAGIVKIEQDGFSYTTDILPEEAFVLEYRQREMVGVNRNTFTKIARMHTALDSVSKLLSVVPANVQIYQQNLYIVYSNIAVRVKLNEMVDCAFAGDVFRRINAALIYSDSGKVDVSKDDSGLLIVKSKSSELQVDQMITAPTQYLSVETLDTISMKMNNVRYASRVYLPDYESVMSTIGKTKTKQMVDLSVTKDGLRFTVTSPKMFLDLGSLSERIFSTRISGAHITAICNVFKGCNVVEIGKGVECLCLQSGDTTLLLSGMIY